MKVLFVCTMNQWRSPTAEKIYRNHEHLEVRSGGTSSKARRRVSLKDIRWADLIVVMENKHRSRLRASFPEVPGLREMIVVIDVEDRYQFMDPRLIEELKEAIDPLVHVDEGG